MWPEVLDSTEGMDGNTGTTQQIILLRAVMHQAAAMKTGTCDKQLCTGPAKGGLGAAYKNLTDRVNALEGVRCGVLMYWCRGPMSTKKFLTEFTTNFKSGRLSSDFIMGLIRKAAAWYTAFVSPWKDALEENKD
jgi:hypothetical protein